MTASNTELHNLLVLSDVHLGGTLLVDGSRPVANARRDRDLVALLEWYRRHPIGDRPWRLVIAGDFVDFVGMSVRVSEGQLGTPPNDEEREHGLGGSSDHTLAKLALVARGHASVFEGLARFVAAGNTLVVLRGNHDVDLHWEAVQRAFVSILGAHASIDAGAIEFAPWFYWEEGVVYIEHGHQYDPYCSYDNLLHPVCPNDQLRTSRSLSDVLLRRIVRPTRGMTEAGHDAYGAVDYLRFAVQLGVRGAVALAARFIGALGALLSIWREHFAEAAEWVQKEHERKMALLGEAKRIGVERLTALARLQRPPVTRSLLGILGSMMVDRVVVTVLCAALLITGVSIADSVLGALTWVGASIAAATVAVAVIKRVRLDIDPTDRLRECAPRVASLFPAAFVVMGHTHVPEVTQTDNAATTYINLGAWAEDDTDAPALPATRTHLVVQASEGAHVAELYSWISDVGPRRFENGTG